MSAGVILFVAFAACLVIGVPVSISLGVAFPLLRSIWRTVRIFYGNRTAYFRWTSVNLYYGHRILRTCRKPDDKRWYLPPYRKLC